ncbi:hypothetical protein ACFQBY_10515 [Promicromonospora citrea]|uniref:Uncharacterized protein n=2 Tax=Promicromonospora citrea TaxID=43677 RepID=A0A8H9GF31_9MICO|nr:hypothetical protein [Promicromonospora citrea]GGM12419.1 hypothetical protein GCM10010102_05120 [Promicromonospora citrea]
MVSSAITPTRTIAVLIGIAVLAVAGFALVRSGVLNPGSVQGAIPGPGTSSASPSASISASEDPSTSPSASPSPTTPEQIKQKNIADAKARLVEYYEATARVANSGYKDWERSLVPFWGSFEIRDAMGALYSQNLEAGYYTTGAAKIESAQNTGYRAAEAGYERASFEVCVDFSQVKTFEENGTQMQRQAGAPTRYYISYEMRHHGTERGWAIDDEDRQVERAC